MRNEVPILRGGRRMKLTKEKCMELMQMVVVLDVNNILEYDERDKLLHRIQLELDAIVLKGDE